MPFLKSLLATRKETCKMAPQLIDSGISIRHAKQWKTEEAIREILQNYLDVRKEFNVSGRIVWDGEDAHQLGTATIQDYGPGLELRHFAFGETEKSVESIGQFGEGLKSALLHLVREGRNVQIFSKHYVIQPTIQTSSVFGIETLHYLMEEEPNEQKHPVGTKVNVQCSAEELDTAEQYFLEFAEKEATFTWLEKDKISLPGGKIYVKGSYICDIDSDFSYHFGESMAEYINRDRNAMNMQYVTYKVEEYLENCESKQVIQWVIELLLDDKDVFENRIHIRIPNNRLQVWQKIWEQKVALTISYQPILLSSGNTDLDAKAQYKGYHILSISGRARYCLEAIIDSVLTQTTKDKKKQQKLVRQKELNQEEQRNLSTVKKLVRKHYAPYGSVEIYDGLTTEAGRNCDGQFHSDKDLIKLNRDILMDFEQTLHTLLHETVHKVSGESDLTDKFERALLQVAVEMMKQKVTEKGNVRK